MAPLTECFSIGDLSRRTHVKVDTIRYYERVGLLPKPPRTRGGQRVYGETHVVLLGFVRHGRQLGFTPGELRTLIEAGGPGAVTCAETKRIALAHLGRLRATVESLTRLEALLAQTLDQCSGEAVPACAVVDLLLEGSAEFHSIEPTSDAPVG